MCLYVVPSLMLVLEVSKSSNICAPERQCHPHQPSWEAICLGEKIKYLLPGPGQCELSASSHSDPLRAFEQLAASHGYLLNINSLTNLLANTWSKPGERKKTEREQKTSKDNAWDPFNRTLETKFSTKLKISFEDLSVVCGAGVFLPKVLFFQSQPNSTAVS